MRSPSPRSRIFSGSRGFVIGAVLVLGIIILQMGTSLVGALSVSRQSEAAAVDTFGYAGDLTAERVARYAESASDVAEGTAVQIEREPDISMDRLATSMYLRLTREPTVRGMYVGWPDGSFLVLRRNGSGFEAQSRLGAPGQPASSADYDARFRQLGKVAIDSNYDPRARPWYRTGVAATGVDWTDPYLQFGSSETLVSASRAAAGANGLMAVAGADLELMSLGEVLADLPLGEGAEAYVLSSKGAVIAAPSPLLETVTGISTRTGGTARAADLGVVMESEPLSAGVDYVSEQGETMVLERTLEPSAQLDWVLHLSADSSQLSPGLDRLTKTVVTVTVFSLLITIGAVVLGLRVWHPLRAMRERANTDQLTGLANRHDFQRRGATLVTRALERGDTVMAVAFDLDNFKGLNDAHGHEAGDQALEIVALALRESIRGGDIAARTGGDEFVVMQVLRPGDEPFDIVARTRDHVEHELHTRLQGGESVGVTAGYATATDPELLDGLVARADAALVAGKRQAKGRVHGADSAPILIPAS